MSYSNFIIFIIGFFVSFYFRSYSVDSTPLNNLKFFNKKMSRFLECGATKLHFSKGSSPLGRLPT